MTAEDLPVALPVSTLDGYRRFSLFNSPYPAHDGGYAIDMYPVADPGPGDGEHAAPSPVAGPVRDVRRVRAPLKPYAAERDHLLLVDCDAPDAAAGLVARLLHVDPAVAPGDRVAVGDSLGTLVRSGFFAQWVGPHVHLGFRAPDQNPHRARGSLPVNVDVPITPLDWDGAGTVVSTGKTYAVLDSPAHPEPGEGFVALAADDGTALDGGLVHYRGGGVLTRPDGRNQATNCDGTRPLSLLGQRIGVARGRQVDWANVALFAEGERLTGLSLFAARRAFGVKLICPGHDLAVGDDVAVSIEPTDEPTVLGNRA